MAVVYLHKRNDTNEIFYVGIGYNERRAFVKHKRTDYWKNIVKKYGYTVDILVSYTSWEDACKIEKLLIEKYGRKDLGLGNLINMTDGGEGAVGVIMSEDTRKKLSEANKGKTHSDESKQKMSEANKGEKGYWYGKPGTMKGKTHSEETKQKISETNKGKPSNRKGVILSEETKQKMIEAKKGKPSHRKGVILSEETKQKMSEAKKGMKYVKKNNIFATETPPQQTII
jgi:hypothetical protein